MTSIFTENKEIIGAVLVLAAAIIGIFQFSKMNKFKQKSGDNSTNYQAETINIAGGNNVKKE